MKYKKDERLVIGRRIYEGDITTAAAAAAYGINFYTARDYLREYKASINTSFPQRCDPEKFKPVNKSKSVYENMTREQLIDALIKSEIEAAKAKKGYQVKEDECQQKIHSFKSLEFEVILQLSAKVNVKLLCEYVGVSRSGFYKWKKNRLNPCAL